VENERPLRIAVVVLDRWNVYQRLLHAALAEHAVSTLPARPTPWWVWRRRADFDVVHLHWIEFVLNRRGGRPLALAALLAVVSSLAFARLLGKCVVWTVHNPEPHDRIHPQLERALFRAVARLSDVLVVHTEASAAVVRARLPAAGRIVVIPHGNYIGAYSPAAGRDAMRARYGLRDDDLVLLAFGQVRPYKRLLHTVRALREFDDERLRLVVVGKQTDSAEAQRLREVAAGEPRIVLDLRHVPDAEVSALHAMADACMAPYVDRGFVSGALLLGLSHGLPVLAPADGTASEVALSDALIEFTGGDLAPAVAELRRRPVERMRAAALASAERVPWSASARALVQAYRECSATRDRR
jgi:glycosyltransferase involved in cell wall biosynthesis